MKKLILLEVLRQLDGKPVLKKKLKVFAVVGTIGFVLVSGALVWAGFAALRFVNTQVQSVSIQSQVEGLQSNFESLPAIAVANCWDKAMSLLRWEPWARAPASEHLYNLKQACLKPETPICEGDKCNDLKMQVNTAEREII